MTERHVIVLLWLEENVCHEVHGVFESMADAKRAAAHRVATNPIMYSEEGEWQFKRALLGKLVSNPHD